MSDAPVYFFINPMWGYVDDNGWHPSLSLEMTADEQYVDNVKNGFEEMMKPRIFNPFEGVIIS